jgi:RsiW-degrading membrane proteinase PrsW (M82 family)
MNNTNSINLSDNFIKDIVTFLKALVIGVIPSIIWLFFWLQEDTEDGEPKKLIFATFLIGMIGVLLVLPFQKIAVSQITDSKTLIIALASIEEVMKCFLVFILIRPTRQINKPLDYAIYLIIVGLGFAALENTLYILKPLLVKDTNLVFLTGNLRFMGSTLLHATSSGIVGMAIGLVFFQNRFMKLVNAFLGLMLSIFLHSSFNFFIMKGESKSTLQIFIFLWVVTVLTILVFEKLRRMSYEFAPMEEDNKYE